jgi:hypothetical protein
VDRVRAAVTRRRAPRVRCALAGAALVTAATLWSPVGAGAADAAAAGPPTVWLCRPGMADDPCTANLTTRVVQADGSRSVQIARPAADPTIDCFYVYPTVSGQPTENATLAIDPEERTVAVLQASRFSQVCRVYAPMYPQLTLKAIADPASITPLDEATAYLGVLSAWKDYLAHDNHGRGVVLIGHSQGSAMLIQLLRAEIDPFASVRRRLVSALLMGGNVTVPVGRDVGGDFRHIPACRSSTQTGCVVAYSSFLNSSPPPSNSLFGRVGQGIHAQPVSGPKYQVLCTNPAALGGGTGTLLPYFLAGTTGAATGTPWVAYPGRYAARCRDVGGASWLQVTPLGGPADTRPVVTDALGPTWGLHLDDVNLALGNLVRLVGLEARAYHS